MSYVYHTANTYEILSEITTEREKFMMIYCRYEARLLKYYMVKRVRLVFPCLFKVVSD